MPNHATPGGSWGKITIKRGPGGTFVARARYKTMEGRRIDKARSGSTGRKAEQALLEHLCSLRDGEKEKLGSDASFVRVMNEWLEFIPTDQRRYRPSTVHEYTRIARQDIIPAFKDLRLRDLTVQECATYLHSIVHADTNYSKAKQNRAVLSNFCTWAAGRGLIPGNPVRQVAPLPSKAKEEVRIIEKEDIRAVLAAVRKYCENPEKRPGPKPNLDVADGIELFLATGARISELLGLRFDDVSIDQKPYSVSITGQIGWQKGKGVLRYDYGKSEEATRELAIGELTAEMLRRRRASEIRPNPHRAIFPARNGAWLHQANWRARWRRVRQAIGVGFDIPIDTDIRSVTPHTFRRSVGTLVAEEVNLGAAARQLGHARTATTVAAYVKRRKKAPDSSSVLDSFMYEN